MYASVKSLNEQEKNVAEQPYRVFNGFQFSDLIAVHDECPPENYTSNKGNYLNRLRASLIVASLSERESETLRLLQGNSKLGSITLRQDGELLSAEFTSGVSDWYQFQLVINFSNGHKPGDIVG